jgi:DNA-binding response OmpR family regulator
MALEGSDREQLSGSTVVVIHDYPIDQLDSMTRLLRELAFDVETSTHGEEGLSVAVMRSPALIISDMTLPDMSAAELCRRVREDSRLTTVPILMVSGLRRDSAPVLEALAAGATDYLRTPYTAMAFLLKVVKLTSRKHASEPPEPRAIKPQPEESRPAEELDLIPRGTETLLLVEEDIMLRNLTTELLELFGYTVLVAGSASEAIAVAHHYQYPLHLLMTDVAMSEMSGRTLAEEMWKRRAGIHVLFLSADSPESIIRHGILEPGARFLQKPYSAKALARVLRQILD